MRFCAKGDWSLNTLVLNILERQHSANIDWCLDIVGRVSGTSYTLVHWHRAGCSEETTYRVEVLTGASC